MVRGRSTFKSHSPGSKFYVVLDNAKVEAIAYLCLFGVAMLRLGVTDSCPLSRPGGHAGGVLFCSGGFGIRLGSDGKLKVAVPLELSITVIFADQPIFNVEVSIMRAGSQTEICAL